MSTVIYPGSFDPITLGHIDIISRASKMFDKVIVAVLKNSNKKPLFTIDERIELIRESLTDIKNIEIDSFDGLLADYVNKKGATTVVRGLRAVSDFEYEFQMTLTNKHLNPEVETIFLTSSSEYMYLSSGMVRQVAELGGNITGFVPEIVKNKISEKLFKG